MKRDCPHNDDIAAGKSKERYIYDFQVVIDGEHRATWFKLCGSLYHLETPDRILLKSDSIWPATVGTHADFLELTTTQIRQGRIPTLEQLEQHRTDTIAEEKAEAQRQKQQAKLERIQKAGPDMLAALKGIIKSLDALDYLSEGNPIRAGYLAIYQGHGDAIRAAIAKAETDPAAHSSTSTV